MSIIAIRNKKQLQDLQRAHAGKSTVLAIDFGASWCRPCRDLKAKIEQNAASLPRLVVAYVDVDEAFAEELSDSYGVTSLPTIVFFKSDGSKHGTIEGFDWSAFVDMYKQLEK